MTINKSLKQLRIAALVVAAFIASACTEDESSLGIGLVDSGMVYQGQRHTLLADNALSVRDDSLLTTNYSYGILGSYHDAQFGTVKSVLYTQIALPADNTDINFGQMVIDSVVATYRIRTLYPDTARTYQFHIEVMQLDEVLLSDTTYYSFDSLKVNQSAVFFDEDVTVAPGDTVLRLSLSDDIIDVLARQASADEFLQATKGLRIRTTDAGDEGMVGIDFTHVDTRLDVYYRPSASDVTNNIYHFMLGNNACRFTRFEHDYTGSVTGGTDSLAGDQTLYLEPLGGYNILVSFDAAIKSFKESHPWATVHWAELLLPVNASADALRPGSVLALKMGESAHGTYINDLIDPVLLAAYDGKYDEESKCYRLRVTQHVQGLLRNGVDKGTLLVLNARRQEAARTVINGYSTTEPIKIEIIYSE